MGFLNLDLPLCKCPRRPALTLRPLCPFAAKPEGCTPADRRKTLYQRFYRMVQEERKPADCVVISITNACL